MSMCSNPKETESPYRLKDVLHVTVDNLFNSLVVLQRLVGNRLLLSSIQMLLNEILEHPSRNRRVFIPSIQRVRLIGQKQRQLNAGVLSIQQVDRIGGGGRGVRGVRGQGGRGATGKVRLS